MKKFLFVYLMTTASLVRSDVLYINGKDISAKHVLQGSNLACLVYNELNSGKKEDSWGQKRYYGIHNMSVTIPGYEAVDLVKDDVCLYPNLFTFSSWFLDKDNSLVQRWSCVKYFSPLYFSFSVENDELVIKGSLWRYDVFPKIGAQKVRLTKSEKTTSFDKVEVFINGRSVLLKDEVLEIKNSLFSVSGGRAVHIQR